MQQGFSLAELRSLYIDELHQFHNETIHFLEKQGSLPEGSYENATGIDRSSERFSDLFNKLRSQSK